VSEAEARGGEVWAGVKRGQLGFGPLWERLGVRGQSPAVRIRVLLYNLLVSHRNRSRHSCKHYTKIVKVVADRCP
jgi:hypothetical protein